MATEGATIWEIAEGGEAADGSHNEPEEIDPRTFISRHPFQTPYRMALRNAVSLSLRSPAALASRLVPISGHATCGPKIFFREPAAQNADRAQSDLSGRLGIVWRVADDEDIGLVDSRK